MVAEHERKCLGSWSNQKALACVCSSISFLASHSQFAAPPPHLALKKDLDTVQENSWQDKMGRDGGRAGSGETDRIGSPQFLFEMMDIDFQLLCFLKRNNEAKLSLQRCKVNFSHEFTQFVLHCRQTFHTRLLLEWDVRQHPKIMGKNGAKQWGHTLRASPNWLPGIFLGKTCFQKVKQVGNLWI